MQFPLLLSSLLFRRTNYRSIFPDGKFIYIGMCALERNFGKKKRPRLYLTNLDLRVRFEVNKPEIIRLVSKDVFIRQIAE